jgi:hypothetical protein
MKLKFENERVTTTITNNNKILLFCLGGMKNKVTNDTWVSSEQEELNNDY